MQDEKIYIIGHKNPDLDSVAAAISYAQFKNKTENTDKYIPAVLGKINQETEFILNKFDFPVPEILENASGKKIILVDHNEEKQSVDNIKDADILELVDHHKLNFSYHEPITINIKPLGATCSIIFQEFQKKDLEINKNLAGLMLGAILVDTVITKSPTCTEEDKNIIKRLSDILALENWYEFGLEIFKVRSSVAQFSEEEIIKSDFKDFDFNGQKVGIGQVETVALDEFEDRQEKLLEKLRDIKEQENYHTVVLFITDIIKEGSLFLVISEDEAKFNQAFETKLENKKVYLENILSRKKQVAPFLEKIF